MRRRIEVGFTIREAEEVAKLLSQGLSMRLGDRRLLDRASRSIGLEIEKARREPSSTETVTEKAQRYVQEGRVQLAPGGADVVALVRGDGGSYRVFETQVAGGGGKVTHCECPSRTVYCAHIEAWLMVRDGPQNRTEQSDG